MKILLAVDGSEAGLAALEESARTPWPERSMVTSEVIVGRPAETIIETANLMRSPKFNGRRKEL